MSWFHLVPGRVVGLVSLVLWHCVPSWFPLSFFFQLGFRGLFSYFSFLSFLRKRTVFHRDFLVLSGSGLGFRGLSTFFSFVSFLRNGAPNESPKQLWSWMGFSILPRNRLCSIIISGFCLGFRGLSPYSFGILFQHPFLVPPGFVSLFFWHLVPSSFLVLARVPGLVSLLF